MIKLNPSDQVLSHMTDIHPSVTSFLNEELDGLKIQLCEVKDGESFRMLQGRASMLIDILLCITEARSTLELRKQKGKTNSSAF